MLLRLSAVFLVLLTVGAVTSSVKLRGNRPHAYPAGLFEQPVTASDPIRAEQAQELDRYIQAVRTDASVRSKVFQPDFSSEAAYEKSKSELQERLAHSIGYPPPGEISTEAPTFTRLGADRIGTYYRVKIPVLPGVHSSGLYVTPNGAGARPLVVAIHGAAGSPDLAAFEGGSNYRDLVRGPVLEGYAVWAPQHLFLAPGAPENLRQQLDARARLVGTTVMGIEIAKLKRALDVILARPEVDPRRVAAVGHSYGGLYAVVTAALEPRIKTVVTSCFFGAREDKFDGTPASKMTDLCFENGQTLFRAPELVALIAPRPVQVQMSSTDQIVDIAPARRLVPEAQAYFQKLGRSGDFRYVEMASGHDFSGKPAWEFLKTHL